MSDPEKIDALCRCGHSLKDHDETVGCLDDGPSLWWDDPPQIEEEFDFGICRCIKFRPMCPGLLREGLNQH